MIDDARLAKFNRRAKQMKSQAHVDAAMRTFEIEEHDNVASHVQGNLREGLVARKVEPVEIVIKDPENPTLHESTVQRLNDQAARIKELEAQNAEHEKTIAGLASQTSELLGKIP